MPALANDSLAPRAPRPRREDSAPIELRHPAVERAAALEPPAQACTALDLAAEIGVVVLAKGDRRPRSLECVAIGREQDVSEEPRCGRTGIRTPLAVMLSTIA